MANNKLLFYGENISFILIMLAMIVIQLTNARIYLKIKQII